MHSVQAQDLKCRVSKYFYLNENFIQLLTNCTSYYLGEVNKYAFYYTINESIDINKRRKYSTFMVL